MSAEAWATLLATLLGAVGGGVGAWVAIRVELAVLRTRIDAIEKERERELARLDSIFKLRSGDSR